MGGIPEESGTAGAKSERAGRGRIGGSSSRQRSTGRAGALRPLRTKDARPVQRPPQSPLFGRVLLLRRGRERARSASKFCSIFGGVTVEQAVAEAVLDALAPVRMEADGGGRRATRDAPVRRSSGKSRWNWSGHATRPTDARDNTARSSRRTGRWPARWNPAGTRRWSGSASWNSSAAELSDEQEIVTAEEQGLLRRLATDLPRLVASCSPRPFDLKKRILRTVLKEIVVYCRGDQAAGADPLAGRPALGAFAPQTTPGRTPLDDAGRDHRSDPATGAADVGQADRGSTESARHRDGERAHLDPDPRGEFPDDS